MDTRFGSVDNERDLIISFLKGEQEKYREYMISARRDKDDDAANTSHSAMCAIEEALRDIENRVYLETETTFVCDECHETFDHYDGDNGTCYRCQSDNYQPRAGYDLENGETILLFIGILILLPIVAYVLSML